MNSLERVERPVRPPWRRPGPASTGRSRSGSWTGVIPSRPTGGTRAAANPPGGAGPTGGSRSARPGSGRADPSRACAEPSRRSSGMSSRRNPGTSTGPMSSGGRASSGTGS
ncbi:hypothetical protein ACOBQX_22820 [Actinokineospora sp. G85]|uniref:hypothetical protein n=1 Tax=Actinokineospora sp. G85 TaxID=3406626 RepID=UPI003C76B354